MQTIEIESENLLDVQLSKLLKITFLVIMLILMIFL